MSTDPDTKIVDDRDPLVIYTSGWSRAGGPQEYNSTTSWTNGIGDSATLKFSGTGITVFGTITNTGLYGPPGSSYSVDGGAKTSYVGIQGASIQYKVPFFQSGPLSQGDHTLVVSCTSSAGPLYLDFFQITGASAPVSPSSPPPVIASTPSQSSSLSLPSTLSSSSSSAAASIPALRSITTAASGTSIPASTGTVTIISFSGLAASNVPSTSSSTSHHGPGAAIGAIVGGVFCALSLFMLLALVLFCRQRRRQAAASHLILQPQPSNSGALPWSAPNPTSQVTPFDLSTPPSTHPHTQPSSMLAQVAYDPFGTVDSKFGPNQAGDLYGESLSVFPPSSTGSLTRTTQANATHGSEGFSSSSQSYPPALHQTTTTENGPLINYMPEDTTSNSSTALSYLAYDPPPNYHDVRDR